MSTMIVMREMGARLVTLHTETYSLPTEQKDQYNEFLKAQDMPEEKYSVSLCKSYRTETLYGGSERDVLMMACKRGIGDHFYGDVDVVTEEQLDYFVDKLEEQIRLYNAWEDTQQELQAANAQDKEDAAVHIHPSYDPQSS